MKLILAQFTVEPTVADTNIRLSSLSLTTYKLTHGQTHIYIYKKDYLHILLEAVGGWVWQHAYKFFHDFMILFFFNCPCTGCLHLSPWLWSGEKWSYCGVQKKEKEKNRPAMTHNKLVWFIILPWMFSYTHCTCVYQQKCFNLKKPKKYTI